MRRYGQEKPRGQLTGFDRITLRFARERKEVLQNGVARRMSHHEMLLNGMFKSAMAGNAHSQFLLAQEIRLADLEEQEAIRQDNALMASKQARDRARLNEARAAGRPEPKLVPHPDDIRIVPGQWVEITGPATEPEYKLCGDGAKIRDALMMQSALERAFERGAGGKPPMAVNAAHWLALYVNALLPARLQVSEGGFVDHAMQTDRRSKRALLKETRAAWARAGLEVRRGWRMPELGVVQGWARDVRELSWAVQKEPHRIAELLEIWVDRIGVVQGG